MKDICTSISMDSIWLPLSLDKVTPSAFPPTIISNFILNLLPTSIWFHFLLFPFFLLFVSLLLRICNIIFILLYFYNLILYETVCYNLCCCCCFYFSEGFFIRFDMAQVFWLLLPYPFRNIRTDEKFDVKFYLSKKNFSFWGGSKTFYESLKFFKWCWFIYWHMAEFYDYFIILLLLFLLPLLLFWRLVEKLKLYFRPKAINWENNWCWFLFGWVKGFWS